MMRPRPARWFEVLCARQDSGRLLQALGNTGAVELEARSGTGLPAEYAAMAGGLAEFHAWQTRCADFWPAPRLGNPCPLPPMETLEQALDAVRRWGRECEGDIAALQAVERQRVDLLRWREAIRAWRAQASTLPPGQASGALIGSWLLDPGAASIAPETLGLARSLTLDGERRVYLLVGERAAIAAAGPQIAAGHGWLSPAPTWMPQQLEDFEPAAAAQLASLDALAQQHRERMQRVATDTRLAQALADLGRLDWIVRNVRALRTTALFALVSGWTSDATGLCIERAVAESGAQALLRFPPAPTDLSPPLLLANPAWARPFEVFSAALGVPGRNEADPTAVIAIVAPLLFGYMFGDIGQGAIIAVAGFWLQRRHVLGRLLLSGGIASMAFGWLYGSVFAIEHLVDPLWVAPLQAPLLILGVPLVGGALLLLLGLALNAVGAWWRGCFDEWLRADAGGVLVYIGLLLALVARDALWLAAAGLAWTLIAAFAHRQSLGALAAAFGELLERSVQLLVNTLSFARVGAFALAHAGLSSAVIALTKAIDHPLLALAMLLAGNALILLLEGMVVSIQTTRLVLFEFFTRFLTGAGRVFSPLPPPPAISLEA